MSRPNVLFIITDQQRADHVGFMGNQIVRTPHLDALSERGTVFENAWVSNPVCMPNRSTLLTGRLPSAHGVIFNDRSLDWQVNTFARALAGADYQTALIGKSHLQHGMSRNAVVPYRGAPAAESPYPPGWDELEDFEHFLSGERQETDDFYGFQHAELAIDHGARATGHHLSWAIAEGGRQEDLLVEYEADSPARKRSSHWWQIYQPPYDERFHSTNFVTQRTIDYLKAAEESDKPWAVWCSYPDPHHPMTPPGAWFDRHRPDDMPLPATRHDPLTDAPEHLRIFSRVAPTQQRNWVAPCGYGNDELLREAIAATYGMIEMIDDGIGRIMSTLEELGTRDDTIVVFTSDHGDMMGDHNLFLKGFMHYRGTLQVPLVIDAPGTPASRTKALASSVDLAPTLLKLCGVKRYDGMQGCDLSPLLDKSTDSVRDHVLIEDDVSDITAKLTPIPGKTRTLITERFRYTRNSKGEEQLFDLVEDADEMNDIKGTSANRTAMVERMMDALIAADDAARGAPATG